MNAEQKAYTLFETVDHELPPGGIRVVATIPETWSETGVDAVGSPTFLGPGMSSAARDVVTIATFHCPGNVDPTPEACLDAVVDVQQGSGREGFHVTPLADGRRWVVYDSTDDAGNRVVLGKFFTHHDATRFIVSCAFALHGDAIMKLPEAMAFCETVTVG